MAPRPARIAGVKASLATVAIALLALTACGGDDGGEAATTDTAPDSTEAPAEDLSSYETVADLNEDLGAAGIECTLEYEGLVDEVREISQCTMNGGQANLTIWYDDELRDAEIAAGSEPGIAVAYGDNWTVVVTDPVTAAAVAEAAGGAATDA